ncbi:MAG: PhnD/SsuA/transferrin family substrate-binding protein [Microbacterium sp.]
MNAPLLVGAVAYSPNVVPIWEGIREYFAGTDTEMDFVLYSNYGRQVDALIAGQIEVAWNTNLAWVRTVLQTNGECKALAMRDTDAVFQTVLVAQAGAGLTGLHDLRGRRLALGSQDSAQARQFLLDAGSPPMMWSSATSASTATRSELDAIRAVLAGEADVPRRSASTRGGDRSRRALHARRARGVLDLAGI